MKNIKNKLIFSLCSISLLSGCGNSFSPALPQLAKPKVSMFNTISSPDNDLLQSLNRAIDFSTGTKNTYNNYNVKFYIDGPQAFPEVEKEIANAKESIYIEVFKFSAGFAGQRIAEALVKKAKEGVDVRVVYNFLENNNIKHLQYMGRNGVKVETFNKEVFTSTGVNITHRKLYIFDGVKAFTGGMNIGDHYADGNIHDTLMSYEGEAVKETIKEFFYDWKRSGGEIDEQMKKTLEKPFTGSGNMPLRITVTSPQEKDREADIKRMMITAINHAKKNIKIAMPYFSDDELIERLISAKKRGVDVTVIIPKENNVSLFNQLSKLTVNQFVQGGVQPYWGGSLNKKFNHSKVMTVDDVWTTIGSCNADYRAFHVNQELNMAISDPQFTNEFNQRYFAYHLQNAEKAAYEDFPWYKKPLYSFLEGIDRLF